MTRVSVRRLLSSLASISADSTSAAVSVLDQLSPDTGKSAVRS